MLFPMETLQSPSVRQQKNTHPTDIKTGSIKTSLCTSDKIRYDEGTDPSGLCRAESHARSSLITPQRGTEERAAHLLSGDTMVLAWENLSFN